MDIQKIFAELGRLHLEVMGLNEQIVALQKQLAVQNEASKPTPALATA
jgi:hypothetical protein